MYTRIIALIAVLVVSVTASFALASTNGGVPHDPYPGSCDAKPVSHHLKRAKALIDTGYSKSRWEDKTPLKRSERVGIQEHKFCIQIDNVRSEIEDYRDNAVKEFQKHRKTVIFRNKYTPFYCPGHGWFATECDIVSRESGFNARAENPESTAGGYYQIIDSTWFAFGGSDNGCYHVAACASIKEQHKIGHAIRQDGVHHWDASA